MTKKNLPGSDEPAEDILKQVEQEMQPGPALPPESPAAALVAIDDWNEQWLAIRDPDDPAASKRLGLTAELEYLIERTNYLASWCESSGLDSSPLVQFAHDAQKTYFGIRPALPSIPAGVWVLLDRLKFKLQPLQTQPSAGGSSDTSGAKREPISPEDAEVLVEMYLKKHPAATAREVAKDVGIALGRLPEIRAWRKVTAKRKASRPVKPKKAREFTKRMEETIGKEANPGARIEVDDAIWQQLLEEADQTGRAKLHEMTKAERKEMIHLRRGDIEENWEQQQRERQRRRQEDDA
jgi:hypothetical protein